MTGRDFYREKRVKSKEMKPCSRMFDFMVWERQSWYHKGSYKRKPVERENGAFPTQKSYRNQVIFSATYSLLGKETWFCKGGT